MTPRIEDRRGSAGADADGEGEHAEPTRTEASDAGADATNVARTAGRGGLAVLGAKVYFIVMGLLQQVLLPRFIGLAGYGALSRVLAAGNVVNNVVVTSSIQGTSRTVASAPEREDEALRAALRVHLPLAVLLGGGFLLATPYLVRFQKAPQIEQPLLLMAAVVLLYGLYAPLVGALNGRRLFVRQAALDVTFATLRSALMIGMGALFVARGAFGPTGAALGFALAACAIVPIAMRLAGTGRTPTSVGGVIPSRTRYLALLSPIALVQLASNLLMQIDIWFLGHYLSGSAEAAGLADDAAQTAADEWVGVYRACQLFAFLPYQLIVSITQILFPMLARARAEHDEAAVRAYVARGARLAAIATGLSVGIVASMPGSLLHFAFGAEVAARGATTLRLLAIGQGAFTMFAIASTVLTSLGHERLAAAVSAGAAATVAVGCIALVSGASFGEAQLGAAAVATTVALVSALLVATIIVRAKTGAFVPYATKVRVGLAFATIVTAGTVVPPLGRLLTPVAACGLAIAYVVLLVVTRELTGEDVAALRAIVSRRKRA